MTDAQTYRRTDAPSLGGHSSVPAARHPVGWLLLAVLLGFWAVLIHRLSGLWTALPEYSYGWVVPLLCTMMFWERWRSRPGPSPAGTGAGGRRPGEGRRAEVSPLSRGGARPAVPPLPPSSFSLSAFQLFSLSLCLLVFVLARMAVEVIPAWRFALWLMAFAVLGLTWLTLGMMGGARWVGHFFFPVFFFLLAVPWPTAFESPFIQTLTQLNATITVELLSFLKVTAVRLGNLILIEPGMVGVQEACSGIRSFQSTLMVALFLGELFRFNLWRRLVFVVLGAGCSMFFNILRTSFLVWSCNEEGLSAVDKFHDPAGWAVFAASFATLALIGWRLKRGDARERAASGKQKVASGKAESGKRESRNVESVNCESQIVNQPGSPTLNPQPSTRGQFSVSGLGLVFAFLLAALVLTEAGLRWWFASHRQARANTAEWVVPAVVTAPFKPLPISKEVRAMLAYSTGDGWEWQGGGSERWQAFLFSWDKPTSLGRKIISSAATTGHQPEVCFTAAGMQVRQVYGYRRYVANGVPLVFKVYEFADRNIPIFVFACTWERGVEQRFDDGLQIAGEASTTRGVREALARVRLGDRGIVDEVRVFKLGVWGPRTIGEAEAAFQQQLNQLVRPVAPGDGGEG